MFDVPRIIDGSKAVQRSDASRPERLEGLDVDTYLGVSRSGKGKIAQGLEADAFRVVQPFRILLDQPRTEICSMPNISRTSGLEA